VNRRQTTPPPQFSASDFQWPTLSKLKHPAAFFLGRGRRKDEEEEGSEFERILDEASSDDEEEEHNVRLRRLFGKPRFNV
jgi:hypothetical protein